MRNCLAELMGLLLAFGVMACRRADTAASETRAPAGMVDTAAAAPATVPAAAVPAGVRLSIARTPEHGAYLTDAGGRSLYLLESDSKGGSGCYDSCMGVWPPLSAGQAPPAAADPAVQASMIGTTKRRDGLAQVTYNGHPLYYYVGDRGPGQTQGQHVEDSWGEWYLVSPSGGKIEDRRGRDRRGDDH